MVSPTCSPVSWRLFYSAKENLTIGDAISASLSLIPPPQRISSSINRHIRPQIGSHRGIEYFTLV
jgi:hypothetical protein